MFYTKLYAHDGGKMEKKRIIFHVDVNSAFLSWECAEQLKRDPNFIDLRQLPSAIGGDKNSRHGIILAKSTKAKQLGIVTGEPIVSALKKCPSLVIVPPNFQVYTKYSESLINLLLEYTDKLQQFSIDEAFLDMTETCHLFGEPLEVANQIRTRVQKELGFTVNIGVSTNKLLAKMASDFKKPNLCHSLYPQEINEKMWPLPVDELFFVGRSAQKKVEALGIRTIKDLATMDLSILKSHLGTKYGELIYRYANGIDDEEVKTEEGPNKGYGNSITLFKDITDLNLANHVLLALSETVSSNLRNANVKCNCITVEWKDYDFVTRSHQTTLESPVNTTNQIYETACKLLKEGWDMTPLRLLGIRATKLNTDDYCQLSLFHTEKDEKLEKLDLAIDKIRNKFGTDSIKRASFLTDSAICKHHLGKK